MNTPIRYVIIALVLIITLHSILTITHDEYSRVTSLSNLISQSNNGSSSSATIDIHTEPPISISSPDVAKEELSHKTSKAMANATFVILAHNDDLDGTIQSMREMEDRFNRKHGYPWVLLNEVPFTPEFIKRISIITTAPIEFGIIPYDHWYQPNWVDEAKAKAKASRDKMKADGIIYRGGYRNMCRFNSGVLQFFYRHKLLQKYWYYWRVKPNVHFHCEIDFDPFLFMEREKKTYGFTITMYEFEATIKTLWSAVKEFVTQHPQYVAPNNALGFLTEDGGDTYNLCHFWSNFEIADMDFWHAEAYATFFNYLDLRGGFYYERWGDAPVHSIAVALFTPRDQLHFFNDIGYEHPPYTHCPRGDNIWSKGRCACDLKKSFDYDGYSCMTKWDRLMNN
ncbi:glycosyltransferase family 15 protein [Piloderma croceum F 1598]|uniref:Glycosyltransferase family 15 protein n=1 Tax=Piloderma croceum (strain F 1598) TaxID=765440 RepID=A0A0C3F8V1_PILCF|nr:glycosyltransferase family 15 protein [Piloderma croceum F 1598]